MSKWGFSKLGLTSTQFIDGDRSKKYPSRSEFLDFGVLFLNGESINTGIIKKELANHISEEKYLSITKGRIKQGDILLTTRGNSLGDCAIVKTTERGLINAQMLILRPQKAEIDSFFLFYYLRSNSAKDMMVNISSGSAQPQIPIRDLKFLSIPIPPLPIQKKVAAVLSAYDDLIENNDRRITLLEKMAEEIYREWFVRLRFPGHEQTTFYKGIPEGWKLVSIGTLCKEIRNGVKIKNLDINTKYLGLEHLPRKSILINDFTSIDSVQSDKLLFNARDILFGKIRPYLHKIVLADFDGACSSDTIILRSKKNEYEGFLLFTIFSDTFVELATISSKGTKMPRADWGFLKELEIILPSPEILSLYQEKFNSQFALMCKISNSNNLLKQTRDRLLTRLISGKLSVEDLDIQFPPSMIESMETSQP